MNQHGLTLVELMIVTVIIGILSLALIPLISGPREQARVAVLKSDLRSLLAAQEGYFAENQDYTVDLAELDFEPSPETTLTIAVERGPPTAQGGGGGLDKGHARGWSALAEHVSAPVECALYTEGGDSIPPATAPGIVGCSRD